jgi:hypothetical protein
MRSTKVRGRESALQAGYWRWLGWRRLWQRASTRARKGCGLLVLDVCWAVTRCAHQDGRRAALDVLGDAVEDGYATAHGEQQHRQQRPDGLDAPCPPSCGRPGLGPYLFCGPPALPMAERDRDVPGRRRWLRGAAPPGFNGDDGEACQQQHDGDSVQRLVEGERVVDGRRGAQVAGCQDEAAVAVSNAVSQRACSVDGAF